MNINETDPSTNPNSFFNEENVNPQTFDSDEEYSSESSNEIERYGNPITFSYGVPVTTPLTRNNMASPPAVERGISNRNNNDPGDLASRMEEMSYERVWWTGDTPDKLGVTPLSVIEANEGNSEFEKDYGAYMPGNMSNPVWRALIKPLIDARSRHRLAEQLQFSLMDLDDYIKANNFEDENMSVDEIRREIGWPIREVYNNLNSGWRGRAGGSPVVGGKRKSKRRLGKSKKGKKGKKSRGRKGKNSKKKRKSRKTKTKKSRQNK